MTRGLKLNRLDIARKERQLPSTRTAPIAQGSSQLDIALGDPVRLDPMNTTKKYTHPPAGVSASESRFQPTACTRNDSNACIVHCLVISKTSGYDDILEGIAADESGSKDNNCRLFAEQKRCLYIFALGGTSKRLPDTEV